MQEDVKKQETREDNKDSAKILISDSDLKDILKRLLKSSRRPKKQLKNAPFFILANGVPFLCNTKGKNNWEVEKKECLLDRPPRRRGNVFFSDLNGWADYVLNFKTKDSNVYICAKGTIFSAYCIFNDGRNGDIAEWGDYIARFDPGQSIELVKWIENDNKHMSQEDMAYFLEDRLNDIAGDGKNDPSAVQVLEAVTDLQQLTHVTFRSAVDLSNGMRKFAYVEDGGAAGEVKVPKEFLIGIPIFNNEKFFAIRVKLRYKIDRNTGALTIWYQMQQLNEVCKAAIYDLEQRIDERIKKELPIYKGREF